MGAESELEESRREILRLRELLVAKDAELGEAKGRVTELEQSSLRLKHLLALPLALLARLLRTARGGLRRARD